MLGSHVTVGLSTANLLCTAAAQVPAFRQYRRQLYRLLAQWAAGGGGPQYRVDGVFIWSVGTW